MGGGDKHLYTIAELSDAQRAVDACLVLRVLSPACPCTWGFALWDRPGSKGREAGRGMSSTTQGTNAGKALRFCWGLTSPEYYPPGARHASCSTSPRIHRDVAATNSNNV